MNKYTHDLDGNEVDGEYWVYLEESFQNALEAFRRAGNDGAVAIAWRLVGTADDVPAELVQQQQDFWNAPAAEDLKVIDAVHRKLGDIHDEMMNEIARGEYAPVNATLFVTEFIRRVNQAQGLQWWLRSV
jgi:sirohydrochlorin ferrochelatase